MSPLRKMAFKLAFYSLFVLYLIGDLYIWHGFLAGHFDDHFKAMPKRLGDESETVALVYGEPITKSQLSRRMEELAWLRGELPPEKKNVLESLSAHQFKTLRIAAINDLVNAALLRLKTRVIDRSLKDPTKAAELAVDRVELRFDGDHEGFMNALVAQKMSPRQLKDKIAARLKQEEKLESMMKESQTMSGEELRWYYDQVKEKMAIPENRTIQHVFFATLDKDAGQVETLAKKILEKANAGESLDDLAKNLSEDSRSAKNGGHLGLVYRDREVLPGVDIWSLPSDEFVLVKSQIGWHVMRLGKVVPSRVPSFEEAKKELTGALFSLRKERAADIYADNIRREGRFSGRVEIAPWILK